MGAITAFTEKDADYLIAFLRAPERPEGTMSYEEVAGFLFAVACVPEIISPSEWLPIVFNGADAGYRNAAEAEECIDALMKLHNDVVEAVLDNRPSLPLRCAPLEEPAANFGPDAPLGRWCAGFAYGHDWLRESWPETLPEETERFFGAALVTLTFFESQETARNYLDDMGLEDETPEAMAADMVRLFPEAMHGYVDTAAAVMGDGSFEVEPEIDWEPQLPVRVEKIGRNDPCPCGSGMKYKKCCGG